MGLGIFGLLAGVAFYGPELPHEYIPKMTLIGFLHPACRFRGKSQPAHVPAP